MQQIVTHVLSKKQLRQALGIDHSTMTQYLRDIRLQLIQVGYDPEKDKYKHNMSIPQAQVFVDHYCVHLENIPGNT